MSTNVTDIVNESPDYLCSLNSLRDTVHGIAREKGWHDEDRTFGDVIALIHSEASEALEAYREGYEIDETRMIAKGDGSAKPEGIPSEFADIIIRVLDAAGKYDIDIDMIMRQKIEYNRSRPHRHGGKKI